MATKIRNGRKPAAQHTPTPWIKGPDEHSISEAGFPVSELTIMGPVEKYPDDDEQQFMLVKTVGNTTPRWRANRDFILRAVNAHDDLIKSLLELRDRLVMDQDSSGNSSINEDEIELINAALTKAQGGKV